MGALEQSVLLVLASSAEFYRGIMVHYRAQLGS